MSGMRLTQCVGIRDSSSRYLVVSAATRRFYARAVSGAWAMRGRLVSRYWPIGGCEPTIHVQEAKHMAEIPQEAREILDKESFAHVAILNADGSPQVTPVWISTENGNVAINS